MAKGKTGFFELSGTKSMSARVSWTESYDPIRNTSVVSITDIAFKSANWYGFTYYLDGTISINGTKAASFNSGLGDHSVSVFSQNTYYSTHTENGYDPAPWGDVSVSHNSDGTKSIPVTIYMHGYTIEGNGASGFLIDGSSNISLTNIDRSAPVVSISISNIGPSSFKISATSSSTCDIWNYSINAGSSFRQFSTQVGTSAASNVTGLEPNKTYSVCVQARKRSNQVYGKSGNTGVTTLGGAIANRCSNFSADASTVSFTINTTVYNSSYANHITIKNGSTQYLQLSARTWSSGTADHTITLNASERSTLLSKMADLKSFTATIQLVTKNGSTQIGNASTCTCKISTTESSSGPSVSGFTFADTYSVTTGITGNSQVLIQDYSKLSVTPGSAAAKNGASIVSYSVVCSGVTRSNTTGGVLNLGEIGTSGTRDITLTVTDSRGYTASITKKVTVVPYTRPKVNAVTLRRTNDIETEMQLSFQGSISGITVGGATKNSLQYVRYQYKLTSVSSYGSYISILGAVTKSGTSFSYSNKELCNLNANASYDFHLQICDRLNSLTALDLYFVVPQGTPLVALRKQKVGINTPAPDAALHVVGTTHLEGNTRIVGTLKPDLIDYPFDTTHYCVCTTPADVKEKVVACPGFRLVKGAMIAVQFDNGSTASSPTLKVGDTDARAICGLNGYYVGANLWVARQIVPFVFNGTWWMAYTSVEASTSRYGPTKLSSSTSSTSTTTAATPSAVKKAYDRNNWPSISLGSALTVANGGTGSTNAAGARSNLGVTCVTLYSGTLSSGSTTFNYGNYNAYIIIGEPNTGYSKMTAIIPKNALTTSDTTYQIADESYYRGFKLRYSGSTVTLTIGNGSGNIKAVYGIN